MLQIRRLILFAISIYVDMSPILHKLDSEMTTAALTIKESYLRAILQATEDVEAVIVGRGHGFALKFRVGDWEKLLETSRGEIRTFASLDTAGIYVRDLGISKFEVDMTEHQPGRLRRPRPDRAKALRGTATKLKQQQLGFQHEVAV